VLCGSAETEEATADGTAPDDEGGSRMEAERRTSGGEVDVRAARGGRSLRNCKAALPRQIALKRH